MFEVLHGSEREREERKSRRSWTWISPNKRTHVCQQRMCRNDHFSLRHVFFLSAIERCLQQREKQQRDWLVLFLTDVSRRVSVAGATRSSASNFSLFTHRKQHSNVNVYIVRLQLIEDQENGDVNFETDQEMTIWTSLYMPCTHH